ncbi:MAG: hypothetical protein ACYC9O_14005, partial [Candidatus Latescibacterota bacterium]
MRKLSINVLLFTLAVSTVSAANFTPTPLRLSAPGSIRYDFDGRDLNIPVTVSGTPGAAALLIFTRGKGASIGSVRNGHLGWHYTNGIDTCLFVSPFMPVNRGTNLFSWNGRDEDGALAPAGEYTYYIWAIDTLSPRTQMTRHMTFSPWNFRTILTRDATGNPLSQPILYTGSANRNKSTDAVDHTLSKWVVGGDPQDGMLRETTAAWGWCAVGGLAFQPDDYRYF